MQKNMIFSGLNNVLTEGKNLKMKRNIESIEDNFNFGKYNTLLEIKKELNEETKNDNDYFNKQNHLFKHNSYKGFQSNELFHKNLNFELERNKNKILKENNISNINNNRQNYEDILKKINNNYSNNSSNDEIENLKNKISQYEISLENTKNQYQKQINFYIEQLNNYSKNIFLHKNSFLF